MMSVNSGGSPASRKKRDMGVSVSGRGSGPSSLSGGSPASRRKKKDKMAAEASCKKKDKPTGSAGQRAREPVRSSLGPGGVAGSAKGSKPKVKSKAPARKSAGAKSAGGSGLTLRSAKGTGAGKDGGQKEKEKPPDAPAVNEDAARWTLALDDPVAEAQRLEGYKARRRERFNAVMQRHAGPPPPAAMAAVVQDKMTAAAAAAKADTVPPGANHYAAIAK